jgi:hypothetical protein
MYCITCPIYISFCAIASLGIIGESNGSISLLQPSPKLEPGARSQESGGKRKKEEGRRKKEGARISVFTNMRCSQSN